VNLTPILQTYYLHKSATSISQNVMDRFCNEIWTAYKYSLQVVNVNVCFFAPISLIPASVGKIPPVHFCLCISKTVRLTVMCFWDCPGCRALYIAFNVLSHLYGKYQHGGMETGSTF